MTTDGRSAGGLARKALRLLRPLYLYRGVVLLAQILYYRVISTELGFDQLGLFAQFITFTLLGSALLRFGCHTATGHVIRSSGEKREEEAGEARARAVGFTYAAAALGRSVLVLAPLLLGAVLLAGQPFLLFGLSLLYAATMSCSFLERAMGRHPVMVMMDAGFAYPLLLAAHYALGMTPATIGHVFAALAVIEGVKLVLYLLAHARCFDRSLLDGRFLALGYRGRYAVNDLVSVVSNNGMHLVFPLLLGPAGAGVFFLIQRLSFPFQFILSTMNAIVVSKLVRAREGGTRRIFLASVRELVGIGALILAALVLGRGPLLAYFDLAAYETEFLLMAGGMFLNLLTGSSAPVFNTLGRPVYNFAANFGFFALFMAGVAGWYAAGALDLVTVCALFAAASAARNVIVALCLRRMLRGG